MPQKSLIPALTLVCLILGSFVPKNIMGQSSNTAEVRGFVYDKSNGAPVLFANVVLEGKAIGAATDVNGFYAITRIPAGQYVVTCTYLGYDTVRIPVTLKAGEIKTLNLNLSSSSISLGAVDITASKLESRNEVQVSVTKINPLDIKRIPSVGGEPDIAQYLQTIPGIVFTGDQGGQLYIRGGSPIQNQVLLDGMVVYNPFHSIGLFSVFETDIIRSVDVYTGGFGAEYGGRISAVMDIRTREGNRKEFSGQVGVNPFTSRILLEGPFRKLTEDGSSISWMLSARTSYLEQTAPIFYEYADSGHLPYNFTDFYGKLSFNSQTGSKLNLFGFNYSDRVRLGTPADFEWDALGAGGNFVVVPGSSTTLIEGNFAFSNYQSIMNEALGRPRQSSISGFNGGLDFTYFLGDDEFKYGFDLLGYTTDYQFVISNNAKVQARDNTTELAGFITYKVKQGSWLIEPGVRVQYYASLSESSLEPRLGAKYLITDRIRLKAAAGRYSQNLLSGTSDRDVVNLFSAFLSSPNNLPRTFDGEPIKDVLQKSWHLVGGVELDLGKRTTFNVEPYIKEFTQLISINRNKLFDDNGENASVADELKKDYIIENGTATGIDLSIKYETVRTYLWAAYSLASVDRYDGRLLYFPHYDRRHNANFISSYKMGKDQQWEWSLRYNVGSGFPFPQTQGFYERMNFADGIGTEYKDGEGELGIFYGDLNGGRLPWYHRVDASIKREWIFTRSSLEASFNVSNVLNRENIFFFDRISYQRVNQLPILPAFGMVYKF